MERDLSMSKNSTTITPPCGSISALPRAYCQARDDSGSWRSSVDTRSQDAKLMMRSRVAGSGGEGMAPGVAVIGQDAAGFAEHRAEGFDVGGRAGFQTVLAGHSVVAFGPVGRAGHDAVSRASGHRGEHVAGIAHVDGGAGAAV